MNTDTKIAWLFTTMGYGDQLLYWEPILSKLTKKAPKTLIYLTPGKVISKDSHLCINESLKIHRITIPAKSSNAYNKIISIISPKVLAQIWKQKPDILVLSEFGLLTLYGMFYKLLRPSSKILLLVESNPGPMSRKKTFLRKLMCKFATTIMTNNESGLNYLKQRLNVIPNKIICKPYLVSEPTKGLAETANLIGKARDYINSNKVKALYVGQLAVRKGIDHLLKAISNLDTTTRNSLQMAIVGGGSDEDTNRLQLLSKELGIENAVIFVGRVPYGDLESLYINSDLFVMSTLNDYRALVGFEAISYGLPVLLSIHDGSSKEIVNEGKNGYTFDPLDINDFSEKLNQLIGDSNKRDQFSKQSLIMASKFTSEVAASNLAESIEFCRQQ